MTMTGRARPHPRRGVAHPLPDPQGAMTVATGCVGSFFVWPYRLSCHRSAHSLAKAIINLDSAMALGKMRMEGALKRPVFIECRPKLSRNDRDAVVWKCEEGSFPK